LLETSCRIGLCLCIMSAGRAERQIFRLHLGNLSPTISIDDIESRFRRFGEVQEVNILLDKFPMEGRQPQCRGFAYVSLYATSAAIEQCRTTFNGCNWKGRKLRVNYAKPDFETLRKQELNKDCLKVSDSD